MVRKNVIVYFVFLPALVCSSLTKTITFGSLLLVWFMPLNVLLTYIIGAALGWLFLKIIKAPSDMQGLVLGCCAAGNLGSLPLIIVPAVCKECSSPFGAVDVCNEKGMAYASVLGIGPVSAIETDLESHSTVPVVAAEVLSETNDHVTTLPGGRAKVSKRIRTLVDKLNLKVILSPATIGSILGLIIGVVLPFRKMFVGDNAPLNVVEDSASMLGEASIPAMTLLLGANLLNGLKRSGMKFSLLMGITVIRYIALPILGVVIVKGAIHFGIIHHDPLYQFVLLLQYVLPPATSTITQLFGAGQTECSIVMLATYACNSFSLTLWSSLFMWLVL